MILTEVGRKQYARRKWPLDVLIGLIEEALGFSRFSGMSLDKVWGEWNLVSLALNVKRL